jgi:hypothetical protein
MMLSSEIWWDGTGSASVSAPVGRRLLNVADTLENPWIHEPLTHFIVLVAVVGSVTIWIKSLRNYSVCGLLIWCLVMAVLSSQWMYLASIAVALMAFRRDEKLTDRRQA